MFRRHNNVVYMDLSLDLRDLDDWKVGPLRVWDYPQNITSLATEPISGLLAAGTAGGVIYVFGGPAIETKLTLPDTVSVRFVQFAQSTFQLVCLDERNTLHIWDLASYGRPKLLKSARFDPTNSLTLSPCLSHAFLALHSGEIRTYDLLCLRKSPYILPNMWKSYEDKLFASGTPYTPALESRICVDAILHPRDLNQLFVAYGGGVILTNLSERTTIRVYELVIPPGAPGGYGYSRDDILSHRRPGVTSLAIHPTGHFFVVGYEDGCLAFWALEDQDKPLLVRTLDELEVNTVDTQRLDEHISQTKEGSSMPLREREPIFKLSWSGFSDSTDPRGGKTTLAILGGLNPGEPAGLTVVQLRAFNPPEPVSSPDVQRPSLHPDIRRAMRDCLDPLESYFYFAPGVIQDYLLIPQNNPHFGGTFDPVTILLVTEGVGDTRTIEAYEYPPPSFTVAGVKSPVRASEAETAKDTLEFLSDDLADALQSLQEDEEPRRHALPSALSHSNSGLLDGHLLTLDRETYQTLVKEDEIYEPVLLLKGGQAWSDSSQEANLKLAKYQPHRILITRHRDLTVRFHDASAQLLIGIQPTPLQKNFPSSLPDLTIDLRPVLTDSVVVEHTSPTLVDHACLNSVYFAPEALETTIVLESGEVIHYRLTGPRKPALHNGSLDRELIPLGHVPSDRGFSPHLMLAPGLGPVMACAITDIGLMAVAYQSALYIIDIRGPEVLLRQTDDKSSGSKHSIVIISGHAESGPTTSLVWTVSQLAKDAEHHIRLIAVKESGRYQILTVTQTGNSAHPWKCEESVTADSGVQQPVSRGAFIIDGKTGRGIFASRSRLAAASVEDRKEPAMLVMIGARGARCFANINGERVGKVDWGSKVGVIKGVQVVEKLGSHVLVIATSGDDALLYSLPQLEYLMTLKLPPVSSSSITLDVSGDFIAWTQHPNSGAIHQATYGTLFDIRRAYELPDIDFLCTKPVIPSAPQPVSLGPASMLQLGSWLPFNQSMTGTQLDELLGGPDRPIPEPEQQRRNLPTGSDLAAGASGIASAAAATQTGLYDRIASALNDRGQVLNDLEERFNALEEGSRSMATQAKRLATQQTAKSWFGL